MQILKEKIGKVGQRGQITLDSKLSGKSVKISKIADGKYMVEEIVTIPKSETWFFTLENKKRFNRGIKSLNTISSETISSEEELDLYFSKIKKSRKK